VVGEAALSFAGGAGATTGATTGAVKGVVIVGVVFAATVGLVGDPTSDPETTEAPEIDCRFFKIVFIRVTYFPIPFFFPSASSEPPAPAELMVEIIDALLSLLSR